MLRTHNPFANLLDLLFLGVVSFFCALFKEQPCSFSRRFILSCFALACHQVIIGNMIWYFFIQVFPQNISRNENNTPIVEWPTYTKLHTRTLYPQGNITIHYSYCFKSLKTKQLLKPSDRPRISRIVINFASLRCPSLSQCSRIYIGDIPVPIIGFTLASAGVSPILMPLRLLQLSLPWSARFWQSFTLASNFTSSFENSP